MTVTADSPHLHEYAGQKFYFCCAGCKTKFAGAPEKYLERTDTGPMAIAAQAPGATLEVPGTIFTCPMHPEVRENHPGACPKCGMALEPELPSADEGENPELVDFRRRFWWTLPLTVAVAVLAMTGEQLRLLTPDVQSWIELALSTPVFLWAGWPFLVRGVRSLTQRSPNMWTLIGLGTSAAFVYSAVATIAPGVFPASFSSMGRVPVYFEAAAVIVSLTLAG
jgi:Cu+-exporting ATPase